MVGLREAPVRGVRGQGRRLDFLGAGVRRGLRAATKRQSARPEARFGARFLKITWGGQAGRNTAT